MCAGRDLRVRFVYDRPPPGETQFPGFAGKAYWRELHRCQHCGHYLEWFEIDQAALYSGDYVTATYGDPAGIRRNFDRINALAPEQSDNIGRVKRILEFSGAHWPASRFAGRAPRLLDVGSGLGVFPYRMKEAGWDCTALDMDPRLVAHHRDVVGIRSEVADVRKADGLGTFDLITFNKVLEHVADPVDVLRGAARLLAPGGFVYIELPDGEAAEPQGKEREEYLLGHVHVFSFASFALLVAHARLRLVECERLREPSTKFTLRGFAVGERA
jgi:2-polyprenyl-3-methyl-5-hydroxy-6-metoxy-1,4-benzoquinol methylase